MRLVLYLARSQGHARIAQREDRFQAPRGHEAVQSIHLRMQSIHLRMQSELVSGCKVNSSPDAYFPVFRDFSRKMSNTTPPARLARKRSATRQRYLQEEALYATMRRRED
jgi:hypothetical protein